MLAEFEVRFNEKEGKSGEEFARIIYDAIRKEAEEPLRRASVTLSLETGDRDEGGGGESTPRILIRIRADDIVMLRALSNSWLRLIKTAKEVSEVLDNF
ncbi:MAG TPA: hypothetical protein ENF26_00150 [Methanomicrobia archaeon]|nr:hypothetical protein [Methanomicrobia archaeon]HEX58551.1 hypothetical protein [Methanomicrobia archaeon]